MSARRDRDLFEPGDGATAVVVAAETGVVTVEVRGDRVGSFGLTERCRARDVASHGDRIAVATAEDVLVESGESFAPTGFGSATVVGTGDGLVAAGPTGAVATYRGGDWTRLGTVSTVREIRDGFIAAADGIHRVDTDLQHTGLASAHSVTGRPVPRAGTDAGIYRLGNGWIAEHDGSTTVVASDQSGDRLHAVIKDRLHRWVDRDWEPVAHPDTGPIVDVAYADLVYAVTADGTLLVGAGTEWRTHPLGVTDVGGLTVAPD